MIKAAGGVVWRPRDGRKPLVLLVHRPKYDDWSFPKGKADADESYPECAIREVAEETGLDCALQEELLTVDYLDRHDRRKRVRYWAMKPKSGEFVPNDEVDAVKWVSLARARTTLTHARDVEVLEAFVKLVVDS